MFDGNFVDRQETGENCILDFICYDISIKTWNRCSIFFLLISEDASQTKLRNSYTLVCSPVRGDNS